LLANLKLYILLEFYIWKRYVNAKVKTRWCCNYLPAYVAKAFTLAEVLITLLIIGIVASIIIPGLIADTQEQEFKVAWKKSYAEINQAINLVIHDNGGTLANMCGTYNTGCIVNTFRQYLNTTQICPSNENNICMQTPKLLSGNSFSAVDSNVINSSASSVFKLTNGALVLIRWHAGDCAFTFNNNKCGWIMVDVNGYKGPNVIGRDVYSISILPNRILPYGADGAYNEGVNDCNPQENGKSCAFIYLYQ